jgi:hypothetical protein
MACHERDTRERTTARRYRTQEVAGSSPASSISERRCAWRLTASFVNFFCCCHSMVGAEESDGGPSEDPS